MTNRLIPIGEVARSFGLNVSALRYYDDMKLVTPAEIRGGKRWYGPEELRRLAFVQLMHRQYSLSLRQVKELLDSGGDRWREVVAERLEWVQDRIEQLERARQYLTYFSTCRRDDPAKECPALADSLQRYVDLALSEGAAADRLFRFDPYRDVDSMPGPN